MKPEKIGTADDKHLDPVEVARIEEAAIYAAAEAAVEYPAGSWFGDLADDEIPW